MPRRVTEPVPRIQESQGRPLFTFSSETASLIKFLTVSTALPVGLKHCDNSERTSQTDLSPGTSEVKLSSPECEVCSSAVLSQDSKSTTDSGQAVIDSSMSASGITDSGLEVFMKPVMEDSLGNQDRMETDDSKCMYRMYKQSQQTQASANSCEFTDSSAHKHSKKCLDGIRIGMGCFREDEMKDDPSPFCSNILDLDQHTVHMTAKPYRVIKSVPRPLSQAQPSVPDSLCLQSRLKNLIFVTGEFAVALHQLGFKNIPPSRESALARGATQYDLRNMDAYNMVVNYSNNDIHIVQRQQEPDKPDHLIDLYGHVTGLCLTPDQR